MMYYNDKKWDVWLKRLTLQTGCEYTIRTGKQTNAQSRETGVIKLEGGRQV